jgi:hypothetical protein
MVFLVILKLCARLRLNILKIVWGLGSCVLLHRGIYFAWAKLLEPPAVWDNLTLISANGTISNLVSIPEGDLSSDASVFLGYRPSGSQLEHSNLVSLYLLEVRHPLWLLSLHSCQKATESLDTLSSLSKRGSKSHVSSVLLFFFGILVHQVFTVFWISSTANRLNIF